MITLSHLISTLNLTVYVPPEDPDRAVTGCYSGDLLSWVMGRAQAGQVWCTIMSNQNVAAVAVLNDLSCVLLTEGVTPDDALLQKAQTQGIALLGTPRSTFEANVALGNLLSAP